MNPKQKRMAAILALVLAGGALTFVALADMGDSLVYYWDVQELLENGKKAKGAAIRLGGMVQKDSHRFNAKTLELSFELGMGPHSETRVLVEAHGAPPQMFREGIGALVEGTYDGEKFIAERVLVKHDNQYKAPKEGERADFKGLYGTLKEAP